MIDKVITEELVDKAAKVIYKYRPSYMLDQSSTTTIRPIEWEELSEDVQSYFRKQAVELLQLVGPQIASAGWRRGVEDERDFGAAWAWASLNNEDPDDLVDPYEVQK